MGAGKGNTCCLLWFSVERGSLWSCGIVPQRSWSGKAGSYMAYAVVPAQQAVAITHWKRPADLVGTTTRTRSHGVWLNIYI